MDVETTLRFQILLESDKKRIINNAKAAIQDLADKSVLATTGDEGDEAQALNETHLSLRFRDRDRQTLVKINQALRRIEDGNFGLCAECEEEIGLKRLETLPTAILCIRCKEAEERAAKTYVPESGK